MLRRALMVAAVLLPQAASAADYGVPHHRVRHVERRDDAAILFGPVVHCWRTHTIFGTYQRCDTGQSEFAPYDTIGW